MSIKAIVSFCTQSNTCRRKGSAVRKIAFLFYYMSRSIIKQAVIAIRKTLIFAIVTAI